MYAYRCRAGCRSFTEAASRATRRCLRWGVCALIELMDESMPVRALRASVFYVWCEKPSLTMASLCFFHSQNFAAHDRLAIIVSDVNTTLFEPCVEKPADDRKTKQFQHICKCSVHFRRLYIIVSEKWHNWIHRPNWQKSTTPFSYRYPCFLSHFLCTMWNIICGEGFMTTIMLTSNSVDKPKMCTREGHEVNWEVSQRDANDIQN